VFGPESVTVPCVTVIDFAPETVPFRIMDPVLPEPPLIKRSEASDNATPELRVKLRLSATSIEGLLRITTVASVAPVEKVTGSEEAVTEMPERL